MKTIKPVDRHVGQRVRTRRIMLKMSQTYLANQLGLTYQQVQKYEKGINRISASRLDEIARVLQVPAHFFFEGGSASAKSNQLTPSTSAFDVFLASDEGRELALAFVKIRNAKTRRIIVRLVGQISQGQTG